jgi:hypothetical protein
MTENCQGHLVAGVVLVLVLVLVLVTIRRLESNSKALV